MIENISFANRVLPLPPRRAVIISLVMAAVLLLHTTIVVKSEAQAPAPAPVAAPVILTPSTGTVGSRGRGTTPGTATTVLELALPELTGRAFSRGGLIEVPDNTPLTKVNLTVSAAESPWIDEQDLLLELHVGDRNRASKATNVSVVVINGLKVAQFVEPDPLEPIVISRDTPPLRVRGVIKKKRIEQEWILQASANPSGFIIEQSGTHDGEWLTIAIQEPISPPILSASTPKIDLVVKGQVTPARNLKRLVVGGIELARDSTEATHAFTTTVAVDASMREFVIQAEDALGRAASVVIPIAGSAARKSKSASR